jgi:hypothetical protein
MTLINHALVRDAETRIVRRLEPCARTPDHTGVSMRLSGFDYSRPMFYMVTLKRLPGRQALSSIVEPGLCEMNPTTRAFVNCIP